MFSEATKNKSGTAQVGSAHMVQNIHGGPFFGIIKFDN